MTIITAYAGRDRTFKAYQDELSEATLALRRWMKEYKPVSGRDLTAYDWANVLAHAQGISLTELYDDLAEAPVPEKK